MSAWRAVFGLWLGASACACSFANDRRPCDDVPTAESVLNQRQDQQELLGGPHSVAPVKSTYLVAFASMTLDDSGLQASSVRYAIVSKDSSVVQPCNGERAECEMSGTGELPRSPVVAKATVAVGPEESSAVVAWIEGPPSGKTHAHARFIDGAGAPLDAAGAFDPLGFPVQTVDVAWSDTAQKVVAIAQDNRDVWLNLFDATDHGAPVKLASGSASVTFPVGIIDTPTVAIAPEGAMLAAWFDSAAGFQVLALDAQGHARGRPRKAGLPGAVAQHLNGAPAVIAVGKDRFVLVGSSSPVDGAPLQTFFQEFSFDGRAIDEAHAVDPGDDGNQTLPSAAYLSHDTLLVTWHSATHLGVVGRFFDSNREPRFCTLGCDEAPFAVGARAAGNKANGSAPFESDDNVWVLHGGKDGRGDGVQLFRSPFAALYPVKP